MERLGRAARGDHVCRSADLPSRPVDFYYPGCPPTFRHKHITNGLRNCDIPAPVLWFSVQFGLFSVSSEYRNRRELLRRSFRKPDPLKIDQQGSEHLRPCRVSWDVGEQHSFYHVDSLTNNRVSDNHTWTQSLGVDGVNSISSKSLTGPRIMRSSRPRLCSILKGRITLVFNMSGWECRGENGT